MHAGQLERITEHLQRRYIEPGKLAGCQVLVHHRGEAVYFRSLGGLELDRARAVREDTIWRIYSMTKPITSVALMTLYERGHFQLLDPVHRYLPEWRGLRVCELDASGGCRLVDAARPVTIRDLLTHTSGLTYGTDPEHPVSQMYRDQGLLVRDLTLQEFVTRLGGL